MKYRRESFLKSSFHYLGSVHFAILLIVSVLLFVIFGTVLESITDSHQFAAKFIYRNPLFISLLSGFFINILFSALRRWPFQIKHLPFLVTHIGLLMLIAGVIIKTLYGTQGTMAILEGGGEEIIFEPGSIALSLESKDGNSTEFLISKDWKGAIPKQLSKNDPMIEIEAFYPHHKMKYSSWIKEKQLSLLGMKPIPITTFETNAPLPNGTLGLIDRNHPLSWKIVGLKTDNPSIAARKAFQHQLQINVYDRKSGRFIRNIQNEDEYSLHWRYNNESGEISASISLNDERITIPLSGDNSLFHYGRYRIELKNKRSLWFILDLEDNLTLFVYDAHGRVFAKKVVQDDVSPIVVYEKGFSGYATEIEHPFGKTYSWEKIESERKKRIEEEIKSAYLENADFFPIMKIVNNACEGLDIQPDDACIDFLTDWYNSGDWLASYKPKSHASIWIRKLDWSLLDPNLLEKAYWTTILVLNFQQELDSGYTYKEILEKAPWKFLFKGKKEEDMYQSLFEQLFATAGPFPPMPPLKEEPISLQSKVLSILFRLYGFETSMLLGRFQDFEEMEPGSIETALIPIFLPEPGTNKFEENHPLLVLSMEYRGEKQLVPVGFDPFGRGIRWPIFNGSFLIQLRPAFKTLPYHLRLRNARQVNYPGSTEPFSYESDLIVKEIRSETEIEVTLSMNHVHQTWDGYRFYLANIFPHDESKAKRAQIIANHDPAKYLLTYPGGFIIALGIILLLIKIRKSPGLK